MSLVRAASFHELRFNLIALLTEFNGISTLLGSRSQQSHLKRQLTTLRTEKNTSVVNNHSATH